MGFVNRYFVAEAQAWGDRSVLDLPDAEHIHLHHQPDGTWHAVPMVLAVPEHDEPGDAEAWWVDAPVQGDDR